MRRNRGINRRHVTARALAACLAVFTVWGVGPAHGDPTDIFFTTAPAIGADPPKAADIKTGDARVSTQTGALEYGYAIEVPPGRNGMQPRLSLAYSSSAPIYGGIAAGWSLPIPTITEDTSAGKLWQQDPAHPTPRYVSSMAGGHPLIAVSDQLPADATATYRAKNDSTFTRYESLANGAFWRARTPDGKTYLFGETSKVDGAYTGGAPCTVVSASNAPLTHMEDEFGNAVDYYYEAGVNSECRIAAITWGQNAGASVADFARVRFNYSIPALSPTCPAGTLVGAQQDYRTGQLIVTGASELDSIVATAYAPGQPGSPVHTRTIALSYSPPGTGIEDTTTCVSTHAAYRALYKISETAVGIDSPAVTLNPITFSYGSAQFGTGTLVWRTNTSASNPWGAIPGTPSIGTNYNLGWGYRFNDSRWPTVEAMMLDVDGDGLQDRVVSSPYTSSWDGRVHCRARWYKNLGNYQFDVQTERDIGLPTLKWASAFSNPSHPECSAPYSGCPQPNTHSSTDFESCSLNYQRTAYVNTPYTETVGCSTWPCGCDGPTCTPPTDPGQNYCKDASAWDYGKTCGLPSNGPTYLAYRWFDADGDGLVDLVVSPSTGSVYDLIRGTGVDGVRPGDWEPPFFGTLPACAATPFGIATTHAAYTRCGNMYPWMIYYNKGNGVFGDPHSSPDPQTPYPDKIVYQPTPLESDTGDSSLTSLPIGQQHATLDLDGDGFADGIDASNALGSGAWGVFRNDTSGVLAQRSGTSAFSFAASAQPITNQTYAIDGPGSGSVTASAGLFDLNGDGLPDYWTTASSPTPATFNLNIGSSFGPLVRSLVRPGNDGVDGCYGGCSADVNHQYDTRTGKTYTSAVFMIEAQRTDTSRVMDVDLDGRPDVIQQGSLLNEGGVFNIQPVATPLDATSILHKMVATYQLVFGTQAFGPYTWELRSDAVDLDGDGILEGLSFADHGSSSGAVSISKVDPVSQPPRLLIGIDNGRGASTTISYASMSDPTVVSRDPGTVMPRTGWVVSSISVTDVIPTTTVSTTTYSYKNPHFSVEGDLMRQRSGGVDTVMPTVDGPSKIASFRGFAQVTSTRPSGAQDIETFDYSVDWSGRVIKHVVVPSENILRNQSTPVPVDSIDLTTWEPRYLFCSDSIGPCALKTYHATVHEHYTCAAGASEDACTAVGGNYTRTMTDYSPQGDAMWAPTRTVVSTSHTSSTAAPGEGDQVSDTGYLLVNSASGYWLHTTSEAHSWVTGGSLVPLSQTVDTYDQMTSRVPITVDVSRKPNSTAAADHQVTTRAYDMATGNVLQRQRPNQLSSGPSLVYTYDSRKLYPATEIDEVGHELDFNYEYGTGTKLETQGPNTAYCVQANNCPTGTVPKQSLRIRVDGLGRTIETWETLNNNTTVYRPVETKIDSYVDNSIPNSTTHQQLYATNAFTKTTTQLDGHGRPTKVTNFVFGSAPTDQITTYQYGSDGTLQNVTVPDPSTNSSATVTYAYGYDSLGRPTSIRRPDAPLLSDRSGVNIAYDGLTTTTTEVGTSCNGNLATTRATKDALGRLSTVDEQLSSSPLSWATTSYAYDGADRVTQVTAPENVITTINYDFVGRRSDIIRAGRTWHFEYDQDDNLSSVATPNTCNVGDAGCLTRFTTYYAYDATDRITSKLVAHRDLSNADLTLFAVDKETYTWDTGTPGTNTNYVGRLSWWKALAPNSSSATVSYYLTYDEQGDDDGQTINSTAAGFFLQRQYLQFFSPHGQVSATNYGDYVGGSNVTSSTIAFDPRGLPQSMTLTQGGVASPQTIAVQTRNVAGLVTKRHTDQTGSPMTYVESNWTYDALGRVASQLVQTGPSATRVAEQDLAYFGTDDPKTLDQYLGSSRKQLAYCYDARHQLTNVTETTTGGAYFNASYGFGPGGRFASASEQSTAPGPGSEVIPRNVTYQYADPSAGGDPEEVTALLSGSSPFTGYAYDLAGNQTGRCSGGNVGSCAGESVDYVYDGQDRLRRATKKVNGVTQGSEEYWYGKDGERVEAIRRDASGQKMEFIAWNHDSEAHYSGSNGALLNVYDYVSLGTPVARVSRTGNSIASLEYEFQGLALNTLASVDASGVVNASFSYAPFGAVLETTNDGGGTSGVTAHPRRFNDKYLDSISGLAYYGARYYDKTLMTWTQSDVLYRFAPEAGWRQPRRANLYTSDLNNPLRYIDPDGRDSTTCTIDGKCTTTTTPSDDADASARKVDSPPPDQQPEGEMKFSEEVGLLLLVGVVCEPCAIALGAGMAAPNNTDGGALFGAAASAGCAAYCKTGTRPSAGKIEGPGAEPAGAGGEDVAPKLNAGKQGKHVPGHNNYISGRSELTHPDPQGLLDRGAGTGVRHGTKEVVDFGEKIGVHVDQSTGARSATTRGTIHHDSSGGAHIVPAAPVATPSSGPKKIQ